jgi:hypothetical protein
VDEAGELQGPLGALTYTCPPEKSAAEGIYLFDQAMAQTGIRYLAELCGSRYYPAFIIIVPAESEGIVATVISKIERRHS